MSLSGRISIVPRLRSTMNAARFSRTRSLPAKLERQWSNLCERYLPVPSQSIWRYSRNWLPNDADQGWKLHISATILNAGRVLARVAPVLRDQDLLYKAPASLIELAELNRGLRYGYSQIGKFITVYPGTPEEALALADRLYALTRGTAAPTIPFDGRYRADGCVFYRYGAFRNIGDGNDKMIVDPHGRACVDTREGPPQPAWMPDLFVGNTDGNKADAATLLKTRFRVFRAMAQRGRGGVYQAMDVGSSPPGFCVLKEGRRYGEVDWRARDGCWRIKHEAKVLRSLRVSGINVPEVYALFSDGRNEFLALELIEGRDLAGLLKRRRRRLPIESALELSVKLARIMSAIHAAGWVWRDCKPGNLMLTRNGELRPLDFEGACPVQRPDPLPWGTEHFVAPEATGFSKMASRLPEDLYALGAVIYFLFSGRTPDPSDPTPVWKLRRNIPSEICPLVMDLIDGNPKRRPSARTAARRLAHLYNRSSSPRSRASSTQQIEGRPATRRKEDQWT